MGHESRHTVCDITDCDTGIHARKWCSKHYMRWQRTGDPEHTVKDDRTPVAERFWPKVNKNGPVPEHDPGLGSCWAWTASDNGNGYGQILTYDDNDEPTAVLVHRWAYEDEHGEIPGPLVLHHCDNPSCVRPSHLYSGTHKENCLDREARGRGRWS